MVHPLIEVSRATRALTPALSLWERERSVAACVRVNPPQAPRRIAPLFRTAGEGLGVGANPRHQHIHIMQRSTESYDSFG